MKRRFAGDRRPAVDMSVPRDLKTAKSGIVWRDYPRSRTCRRIATTYLERPLRDAVGASVCSAAAGELVGAIPTVSSGFAEARLRVCWRQMILGAV